MKKNFDEELYMALARFLSNRVGPYVEGSAGHVRPRKRTQEPVSAPTLGEYTPEEQKLLWNAFYAKEEVYK